MATAIAPDFCLPGTERSLVGEVSAEILLENLVDRELARRGVIDGAAVRQVAVRALVDTGAMMLVLPEEVVESLGLVTLRTVPVT